jgi:predicted small lipoprotein YifL
MMRFLLVMSVILVAVGALGACGKKGPPEAPGENQYPRQYPAPR